MKTIRRRNIRNQIGIIILCVVFAVVGMPMVSSASETERKTVRVGFYPVTDYQEVDENGIYSGFAYDYYVQIQKYTRWNYEFVEASYADCMKMLTNGEIDVMSGMMSSPERENQFIFSDYSNSNTQNKLFASEDNDALFYESYDTFDGCKVGMVKGLKTEDLEDYCDAHHFQVELVTYDSYEELEDALENGQLDMICGASLPGDAKTKIVARMKKQPLYYAVTKSKPEIATELNDALQKIIDNNPEFYAQMSEKYKIDGANATATFTRDEEAYIQSGKQIYLVVNDDLAPISWKDKESGEYHGISIDVAKEIENYSGLHIQPITSKELDELATANPEIMGDTLVLSPDDTAWANRMSIMMTNHVVNSSIVMISRSGEMADVTQTDTRIALPKDFYASACISKNIQEGQILYYDTVQECLDAVNRGKADATYMNSLVARYYMSMLRYNNLYISAESGYSENLSYGVYLDSDTPLLSILDKSLLCIGSNRINQIVVAYSHADEPFSLEGLYYSNPALSIGVVLAFCALIGLTLYFSLRTVSAERRGKQEKTLARFMGYVCAANDTVMEVNLKDYTAHSYSLTDTGAVVIKDFPYHQIHGQNYEEQIYPEDYKKLEETLSEKSLDEMIDSAGGDCYFECRSKAADGLYYWYSYSLQAIPKDREHPRNFILFKKNIDHVKREEEGRSERQHTQRH